MILYEKPADDHLAPASRFDLQLDHARVGCEGDEVDARGAPFGEALGDGENHAVVDVGRQVERPLTYVLPSVCAGPGRDSVLPGRSQTSVSSGNAGPALHEAVALQREDSLLRVDDRLVEQRPVVEAKDHPTLDLSAIPPELEEIA